MQANPINKVCLIRPSAESLIRQLHRAAAGGTCNLPRGTHSAHVEAACTPQGSHLFFPSNVRPYPTGPPTQLSSASSLLSLL